ncbi:6-phospho-3-hexuloisomerase [Lentzea roselyniae]|uniref:6-phospho-3-hexuloisomerase n=2 Tax=Lentzea roselyniae TaxID=531940 RepID=A0ABP7CDL7_9PSEU
MVVETSVTVPGPPRPPQDDEAPENGPHPDRKPGTSSRSGMPGHLERAANLVLSENRRALNDVSWRAVTKLVTLISGADRVFVLGEGRSGLAVRMAAMRLMHLGLQVHVVGETTTPPLSRGDVLIAVSGSGGTPGVVLVAEQVRAAGGQIAALTTTPSSPLAAIAELVVAIPAASKHDHDSESSAQFAGSLFEQSTLLLFDALFHALSRDLGKTSEVLWAAHANLE